MEQVIIRYIDLPCKIKGFVKLDHEGNYNVYINAQQSYEMQQAALKHELEHIERDDFYNDLDIDYIEG